MGRYSVLAKCGVVLCMLLTMAVLVLPFFWYRCEVAINEAYGYENLDSFNMIGEHLAMSFLPLAAGVPLSLLYLLCLKKRQRKFPVAIIALIPFLPWIGANQVFVIVSFGIQFFLLLLSFYLVLPYMLYAFLNTQFLIYCSWDGPKRKRNLVFIVIGYIAVLVIGYMIVPNVMRFDATPYLK